MSYAVASREDTERILGPHVETLRSCIEAAWQRWEDFTSKMPEVARLLDVRARSSFIYSIIVHEAEVRFQETAGVRKLNRKGFLVLVVDDEHYTIEVRFKKVNRKNLSRNYPTKHHIVYCSQGRLPGVEEATRVTAGYRPDPLGLAIEDIIIVQPDGPNRFAWWYSIGEGTADGDMLPLPIPSTPPAPPKVRPKKGFKEEEA